jgi:hypothetical protein
MYSISELKKYGMEIIKESTLSSKDKIGLLKRLQKTNLTETMAFLNRGQMLSESVNQSQKELIEEEFYNNELLAESLDEFLFEYDAGVAATLAATVVGSALFVFRNYLTKARRACRDFMGTERRTCLYRYKVDAYKAAIAKAASSAGKCKSDKNPEKCQAKIENFIAKTKEKLATQERSLASIQGTKVEKEREAREKATTKQIAKRRNLVNVNVRK